MANLPRKLQRILGLTLTPSGNIAKFGTLKLGAPAYSSDLDQIQTSEWEAGWPGSLITTPGGPASPALQDMNAILYVLTNQIAYLLQKGIADYLAAEEYFTNDFVKVAGVVYISKTDNNTGNDPTTDTNNWKTLASTLGAGTAQAKAWVCFNGATQAIYSGYNVSSISKLATGSYVLNFQTPLADANYVFTGNCGTQAGAGFGSGDDNIITGGFSGRPQVKSASQLSVFCSDPQDRVLQDCQAISILIFGNP